jgi:hypothetical protein
MTDSQIILHVGAPKCGSSALQTALTMTPDLRDGAGRRFKYTSCFRMGPAWQLLYGQDVQLAGKKSKYGYGSWPNLKKDVNPAPIFQALQKAWRGGLRKGYVPIASCEGWINHPDAFAHHLAEWGHPPVDVIAFLRPPLDWVNSAYWQWAVWHAPRIDSWLGRGNLHYRFGLDLEAWSKIPNVRLHIRRPQPDVVQKFSEIYGVTLPSAGSPNSSSPPSLIGFLLRNRRFRPSGHDSSVEFIFQRWCPPVPGPKLWAIRAPHVKRLRKEAQRNVDAVMNLVSEAERQDLLCDPKWMQEKPYHPAILAGPSVLDDRSELPHLHAALLQGVRSASEAAGLAVPALPGRPAESASLEQWDSVLANLMDSLLAADLAVRQGAGTPGARGMRRRAMNLLTRWRG